MKKLTLLLIIFVFFSCEENDVYQKKDFFNFRNEIVDTIFSKEKDANVSKLEIIITGNSKKGAVFKYSHIPYTIFREIKIEEGNFNKKIETDWYEGKSLIKYIPKEEFSKDSLTIRYKFW